MERDIKSQNQKKTIYVCIYLFIFMFIIVYLCILIIDLLSILENVWGRRARNVVALPLCTFVQLVGKPLDPQNPSI